MAHQKRPRTANTAGPMPSNAQALALTFFAVLGLFSAFELLRNELRLLGDPNAVLTCDLNPLVACSSSLLSSQAHLFFGAPNSMIGLMAFAALLAFAVMMASRVRLPRWIWWGLALGTLTAMMYVGYFLWQSVTFFRALCPYCMLIWVAAIGATTIVWTNLLAGGMVGKSLAKQGATLKRYWAAIVLIICLLVVLILVIALRQQIAAAI